LLCNRYAAPAKLPIWQMSRNKTLESPEGNPIGAVVSTAGSSRGARERTVHYLPPKGRSQSLP